MRFALTSLLTMVMMATGSAYQADVGTELPANAITSYELRVYTSAQNPFMDTPFRRFTFPATIVRCNQDPPAIGPVIAINPTRVLWQDPANAAKFCVADIFWTVLNALPANSGSYLATLTAIGQAGPSVPSAPSNIFLRLALKVPGY